MTPWNFDSLHIWEDSRTSLDIAEQDSRNGRERLIWFVWIIG